MDNVIGSSYVKPTPTFSFHSIIDEDVSLLSYIIMNYYDESIFDFSNIMDISFPEVIHMIYYRTEENPLKLFAKEGVDDQFLDDCYVEFLKDKEGDILENGIITEIPNLIKMFKNTAGISPSVFYYNDIQLETLNKIEELEGIPKIEYKEVSNDTHSQIYIRDNHECTKFFKLKYKTFYMATTRLNLNVLNDMGNQPHIIELAKNNNRISLYDMYSTEIIGMMENEEGEVIDE